MADNMWWWTLPSLLLLMVLISSAGCSPLFPPTSSWLIPLQASPDEAAEQQEYSGSTLHELHPHQLNYAARPDDRYNIVNERQYIYGNYPHHNADIKSSPHLDYKLQPSYQSNLYQHSYTESSTYGDSKKSFNSGQGQHLSSNVIMVRRLPRRYGDRVWWPSIPLLNEQNEPYIDRVVVTDMQKEHPRASQGEMSHNNADDQDHLSFPYSTARESPLSRNSQGQSVEVPRMGQNKSLIKMVRTQKSRQPGQKTIMFDSETGAVRAVHFEPSALPITPHPRKKDFDSLLKMMTQAGEQEQEEKEEVEDLKPTVNVQNIIPNVLSLKKRPGIKPLRDHNNRRNASDTWDDEDEQQVLPRVGMTTEPPVPVTTTVVLGSIMLLIIIVVMMVALRVHWRERVKACENWPVSSPTVQPPTPAASGTSASPLPDNPLDPLTHLQAEPIRIKAKGLLERRGSNTSLTLELGSNGPPPEVTSPPRHCTPEEYLMTAGNRMSRRQLRNCLRDTRLLHAEFWEVPLNHPDKCDIPGSAAKNRYRTVLPNEATRVHLYNENHGSDYINANYVRGYDGEDHAYIVTQGPLANTVVDLWRLVMQERCPAVVMITRLKEKRRIKCEPYIPPHSATYGDIKVTVKHIIHKNGYTIRHVSLQRGEEKHETLHLWYTAWPDHKTPAEADQLLSMAIQVDHIRKNGDGESCGPVVVHCSAGIGRSGCFIAISIAINQLLEEDCVDILGIVCQMRLDRGGMVQTGEQYEFIHRAVALYEATLPVVCNGK